MNGGGFSLPKLGSTSLSSASPPNVAMTSLADYANAQLTNYEKTKQPDQMETKKFAIPKIFPSKTVSVTIESSDQSKNLVDLKSALVPLSEQMKSLKLISKKDENATFENFIPKFVDCDVVVDPKSREIHYDENCHPYTCDELMSQFKVLDFKRFSSVGKVIKRRFRRKKCHIIHKFKHKHEVVRFQFDTPSPDDIILSHLNKTRK